LDENYFKSDFSNFINVVNETWKYGLALHTIPKEITNPELIKENIKNLINYKSNSNYKR
jgi:hypothetical protein